MALIESLLLTLGPAISKALLKIWLRDSVLGLDITSSLVDLLKAKTSDVIAQQRAKRQLESIGEKIAENLIPIFERAGISISEQGKKKIIEATSDTLNKAGITSELLAQRNLDPSLLAQYLIESSPDAIKDMGESQILLYKRIIYEASQNIVDIASSFPSFTERTFSEVLKREDQLVTLADTILEEVRRIQKKSEETNPEVKEAQFEAEYRRAVMRKLDELQLFGIDLSGTSKRQRLSVAYVSLSVEEKGSMPVQLDAETSESDIESDEEVGPIVLSVNTALEGNRRLLIRGDAGSGKTTLLQWIAVRSASQSFKDHLVEWNNTLPFFIRLREYSDRGLPAPEEFPERVAPSIASEMPKGWAHNQLRSGRAILLVDGVDEVPEKDRELVRTWLRELVEIFPQSRFIITSRPHAIQEGWIQTDDFKEAELQSMEISDIETFIDHWHSAVKESVQDNDEREQLPEIAENLKIAIRSSTSVRRLATSPLLCAMICALHRDRRQQLPKDRIELYEAGCYMLLERRDIERGLELKDYPVLKYREKLLLLQDIAYWLLKNGWSEVDTSEVKARFARNLLNMHGLKENVTSSDVLRLFLERSGIVREPLMGRMDFTHRTFQEFLAAKAILDEEDTGLLIKQATDDQWREVIILTVGLASTKQRERVITDLINHADNNKHICHQLYLLAAACLESSVELGPELKNMILDRLSSVIPPRNVTEAKSLASAGDLAVHLLVSKGERRAREAAACVRSLALIGSDGALSALETYRDDSRLTVIRELERAWNYFEDNEEYGRRVLSNWTRLNLRRILSLDSIKHMSNLNKLKIRDCYSIRDLSPLQYALNLETLIITECRLDLNLAYLTSINKLRALCLWFAYGPTSYGHLNLIELKKLHNLESLELHIPFFITTFEFPRKFEKLKTFILRGWRSINLNFISHLQQLETLILIEPPFYYASEHLPDLRPLSSLTNLKYLHLGYLDKTVDLTPLMKLTKLKAWSHKGPTRNLPSGLKACFHKYKSYRFNHFHPIVDIDNEDLKYFGS